MGVAVLLDHKLAFTRKSGKRGCGVADVVAEGGAQVRNLAYEITDLDVGKLDSAEGFRPGRDKESNYRRECLVFLDGEDQRPLTISAYFGDPQPKPPLPSDEYKNLILVGARYWHLPEECIRELDQIDVSE